MTAPALGVDLGGTNVRVALVSAAGKIFDKADQPTNADRGPEYVVETIADLTRILLSRNSKIEAPVAMGVGCPGPICRSTRRVFQTPNLPGFEDFPLGQAVEEKVGLEVFLDNDANCAAHGEEMFGVAQGLSDFVLLTIGTGIGGGIYTGGQMVYGKSDGAAELGHFILYPEGLKCKCGRNGCYEQYCSATAIERRASEAMGREVKVPDFFWAIDQKEPKALACLEKLSVDFAIGMGSLVNIFDPQMIVLGGGAFSTGGGPLLPAIKEKMKGQAFASSLKELRIESSSLKGNAGVLGAAAMAFKDKEATDINYTIPAQDSA